MAKLLEVKNLKTQFFTQDGVVHAVNGISYTVDAGETVAIVGESGSGKSVGVMSLIRLIPQPPGKIVDGEVWFDGRDLLKLSEDELRHIRGNRIAMIFQDPMTSLNPVLTIGRQITEALELHLNMSKSEARKRAVQLLEMVGIPGAEARLDDYPHQFSGGMRQRIMIAMAISLDPAVLIADEPTTALDVTVQAQIMELLQDLQRERNMGMILITHDLGVVAGVADKIAVMYAGRIVEDADVLTLYGEPAHPYTEGLLASMPRVDTKGEELYAIKGLPPSLLALPPGCNFNPRCPYKQEICLREVPPRQEVAPGHGSACHFWEEVYRARTDSAS